MKEIFVKIMGRVSDESINKLGLDIKREPGFDCLLFFDYSDFEVPIDFAFCFLYEISDTISIFPFNGRISMVTQQWGLPFVEGIPMGRKTICNIICSESSYHLISSKIPIVDAWENFDKKFLLSNAHNDNWKNFYAKLK